MITHRRHHHKEEKMVHFVQLTDNFYLRVREIQAVEYRDSETLHLTFLKVHTADAVYDFREEEAKEAWTKLQKIMELV